MYRGVHPILAPSDFHQASEPQQFQNAMSHAKSLGFCKSNENVIIVSCTDGAKDVSQPLTIRLFTVAE